MQIFFLEDMISFNELSLGKIRKNKSVQKQLNPPFCQSSSLKLQKIDLKIYDGANCV